MIYCNLQKLNLQICFIWCNLKIFDIISFLSSEFSFSIILISLILEIARLSDHLTLFFIIDDIVEIRWNLLVIGIMCHRVGLFCLFIFNIRLIDVEVSRVFGDRCLVGLFFISFKCSCEFLIIITFRAICLANV